MLRLVSDDITTLAVDAIVNAANEGLRGGGGVDGAIHRAAGPELREACARIPEVRPGIRCPTGDARITPGFRLPVRFVIHTVGPVWRGGNQGERDQLGSCYRRVLELAREHEVESIAFPAISCGAFGFPPHEAATIAVREIRTAQIAHARLEEILLVAFDASVSEALAVALREVEFNR